MYYKLAITLEFLYGLSFWNVVEATIFKIPFANSQQYKVRATLHQELDPRCAKGLFLIGQKPRSSTQALYTSNQA